MIAIARCLHQHRAALSYGPLATCCATPDGERNLYVLKSSVGYYVWNRLIGQIHPVR